MSSDAHFEGLPEGVTLPCRIVVDTIVDDDGYVTVTSSKGTVHCRISLEWLISRGIQEEEGFEFSIKNGELDITMVSLTPTELADLRVRVKNYFDAHPEERRLTG